MKEQSTRRRAEKKVIARRVRIYLEACGHYVHHDLVPGKFRKRHMGCGCGCCKPWKHNKRILTVFQMRQNERFRAQLEELRYEN